MIYLIHGSDQAAARAKWRVVSSTLVTKRPGTSVFRLWGEELLLERLEELLVGQTLFDPKFIVLLDEVWLAPGAPEIIEKNLALMAESDHAFVWLEEKLPAPILKKVEKVGGKIEKFELRELKTNKKKEQSGKLFALVDAFVGHRRKDAWVMYTRLRENGLSGEEFFYPLAWKVKTLLLAESVKKGSSYDDLMALSTRLVETYHRARRGLTDLGLALEHLILEK